MVSGREAHIVPYIGVLPLFFKDSIISNIIESYFLTHLYIGYMEFITQPYKNYSLRPLLIVM